MNTRTNDPYNLRTLGTIKELPMYHGSIRKPSTPTTFDDDQHPYIRFDVQIEPDDYGYHEVNEQYGEFSDKWSDIKLYDDTGSRYQRRRYNHDHGPYFHAPDGNNYMDLWSYYYSVGCSSAVADYLARKDVRRCADTLCKFYTGDQYMAIVTVTAYVDDTKVAHTCLGGVEVTGYKDPYVQEIIAELKHELLAEIPVNVDKQLDKLTTVKNTLINNLH